MVRKPPTTDPAPAHTLAYFTHDASLRPEICIGCAPEMRVENAPSQWRKKLEAAVSSSALRLPIRAQNRTVTALRISTVGIRGCRRRSTMPPTTVLENWNKRSDVGEWLALPCQQALPLQLGNLAHEPLDLLVLADSLTNRIL